MTFREFLFKHDLWRGYRVRISGLTIVMIEDIGDNKKYFFPDDSYSVVYDDLKEWLSCSSRGLYKTSMQFKKTGVICYLLFAKLTDATEYKLLFGHIKLLEVHPN